MAIIKYSYFDRKIDENNIIKSSDGDKNISTFSDKYSKIKLYNYDDTNKNFFNPQGYKVDVYLTQNELDKIKGLNIKTIITDKHMKESYHINSFPNYRKHIIDESNGKSESWEKIFQDPRVKVITDYKKMAAEYDYKISSYTDKIIDTNDNSLSNSKSSSKSNVIELEKRQHVSHDNYIDKSNFIEDEVLNAKISHSIYEIKSGDKIPIVSSVDYFPINLHILPSDINLTLSNIKSYDVKPYIHFSKSYDNLLEESIAVMDDLIKMTKLDLSSDEREHAIKYINTMVHLSPGELAQLKNGIVPFAKKAMENSVKIYKKSSKDITEFNEKMTGIYSKYNKIYHDVLNHVENKFNIHGVGIKCDGADDLNNPDCLLKEMDVSIDDYIPIEIDISTRYAYDF